MSVVWIQVFVDNHVNPAFFIAIISLVLIIMLGLAG